MNNQSSPAETWTVESLSESYAEPNYVCANCGNYQGILSKAHKLHLIALRKIIDEKCFNCTVGPWAPKPGNRWRKRDEQ